MVKTTAGGAASWAQTWELAWVANSDGGYLLLVNPNGSWDLRAGRVEHSESL